MAEEKTMILELESFNGELSGTVSELVRCKDCNYYDNSFCNGFGDGHYVPPNGFCFEAEKKQEVRNYSWLVSPWVSKGEQE